MAASPGADVSIFGDGAVGLPAAIEHDSIPERVQAHGVGVFPLFSLSLFPVC